MAAKILSDKGTHYFVETAPRRPGEPMRRLKVRRYLCIGGPRAGVWRSSMELQEEGLWGVYFGYNNGGGRGGLTSQVFIHEDLLDYE